VAWGTLDAVEFASPLFVLKIWSERPALCGVAGIFLLLGITARFGWLIFGSGLRIASEFPAVNLALVFCGFIWPTNGWLLLQVQPMLGCAPETVSLAQGISLIAAMTAAVIATAQADARRTIVLVGTSQFGVLVSMLVVLDLIPANWWPAVLLAPSFTATLLFVCHARRGNSPLAASLGWWFLAAGCLSPLFLTAAKGTADLPRWQPPVLTAEDTVADAEAIGETPNDFRVRPLPVTTWTAAWCAWSFFAAFAAWRGWMQEGERNTPRSISNSVFLSICLAGISAMLTWFVLPWLEITNPYPACAAIGAAFLGQIVAVVVCSDPAQIGRRFQRLGVWAGLANAEFHGDDVVTITVRRPLSMLIRLAGEVEDFFATRAGRSFSELVSQRLNSAISELRNESANFYAGALAVTIGSLLVTWLVLIG
jgi:hypothetical protein